MKEFYTRKIANQGIKLDLYYPDGTPSEHYIVVRGVDSDHFREAEAAAKRKAIEIAQLESELERVKAVRKVELECIASLIAEWSFDEACIQSTVVSFLEEAPQIADMVNRFASRRAEFFSKKSVGSVNGSGPKSPSKKHQKGQRKGSGTT